MSQIHQIRIKYDPAEDRGLLLISTRDGSEFRFWMTRRYVVALWPILVKLLETDDRVQFQPDPDTRKAVLSFQHDEAVRKADFETAYNQTEKALPLGEAPILLARIAVKRAENGAAVLCMHPREGSGIDLVLNHTLLHSFCKLVTDTVRAAQWNIDVGLAEPETAGAPAEQRLN